MWMNSASGNISLRVLMRAVCGGDFSTRLNNKVKVTFRKSYGFRTDKARKIALFHVLGKLPEPKLIHGFF